MHDDEYLFRVKVSTELMVVAKNRKEAISAAENVAPQEIKTYPQTVASKVFRNKEIPEPWPKAVPYRAGKRENLTDDCQKLLAQIVSKHPSEAEDHYKEQQQKEDNANEGIDEKDKVEEVKVETPQPGRPMPYVNFQRPQEEI